MDATPTSPEITAEVRVFLAAHPDTQVILVVGRAFDRVVAADHDPLFTDFAEGPLLMEQSVDVQKAGMAMLRCARQGQPCSLPITLDDGTETILSCASLDNGAIFLLHPTEALGPTSPAKTGPGRQAFVAITDMRTSILSADPEFAEAFGIAHDEVTNYRLFDFICLDAESTVGDALIDYWVEGISQGVWVGRSQFRDAHGEPGPWYQTTVRVIGAVVEIVFVDISADVRSARLVEHQAAELQMMAETVPLGIFRASPSGELLYANSKLNEVFGLELGGALPVDRIASVDGGSAVDVLSEMLRTSEEAQIDVRLELPDHAVRYVRLRVRGLVDPDGNIEVVGSAEDITHEYEQQQILREEALTDDMSGTANRRGLESLMESRLSPAHGDKKFAVLLCDLDGFKQVNDTLGHDAGDVVIANVGERLKQLCRATDQVGRLGGDEFVVIADGVSTADEALEVAERVLAALRQPIDYAGTQIELSASIGIALSDEAATTLGLLQKADHAMYRAKRAGRNHALCYSSSDMSSELSPLALRRDLRNAIRSDELSLAYQPIYRLDDLVPVGAEALLRWDHPTQGAIAPSVVIPVAEQSGLIRELGVWSIDTAIANCAELNAMSEQAATALRMTVNVSVLQLAEDTVVDRIIDALARHNVAPSMLGIELTESHLVDNVENARRNLNLLADAGILVALDDFGGGFASLKYLLSLPVSVLKIDPGITARLGSRRTRSVVEGISWTCRDLGMDLIIEGIETPAHLEWARAVGATHGQGYHLCKPVSLGDLSKVTSAAA